MGLKELLGEELYSQVMEKAGDNKIAIVSNGNWFPKEKFDGVNEENKTLKDTVATLETSLKDFEGYEDKLTERDNKIKEYETANLKYRIANENGIPLELASKLSGETEEDLKKDAETLSSFITKKQTLPLRTTEPKVDDDTAPYKGMLEDLKL